MSLTGVKISEEVWLTCVTHALSTETEEVMGLLLGDIEYLNNGCSTALVWGAAPQTRSDRRKDRVETNPEQLAAASAQAERISAETGRLTRVIGWYHSHPHITVFPSHVDVRTQGMYQLLDPGFIGLIFSCFSEDGNKVGRLQATAFQASNGWRGRNTMQSSLQGTSGLPSGKIIQDVTGDMGKDFSKTTTPSISTSSPSQSDSTEVEIVNTPASKVAVGPKSDMAALEELFVNTVSEPVDRRDNVGMDMLGLYENDEKRNMQRELDSLDLSAGMQEAMHRSNLDLSGAEFTRKEVPLQVVPGHTLAKVDFPLSSLVDLQRILFDEEQTAYNQAISQSRREGKVHPLAVIHHSATYQASLCKLMEYCLSPVLSALWDRLQQNNSRLALLREEVGSLQIQSLSRSKVPHSQRRISASAIRGNVYSSSPERRSGTDLATSGAKSNFANLSKTRGSPEMRGAANSDVMML